MNLSPLDGKALSALGMRVMEYLRVQNARHKDYDSYFRLVIDGDMPPATFMAQYPEITERIVGYFLADLPLDDPMRAEVDAERRAAKISNDKARSDRAAQRAQAMGLEPKESTDMDRFVDRTSYTLTEAGQALVESVEQIDRTGLPAGVQMPASLAMYRAYTRTKLHTPVSFFMQLPESTEALARDVEALELQVGLTQLKDNLRVEAATLSGEPLPAVSEAMAEDKPTAPDWSSVLKNADTFLAWQRSTGR